jgi:hypothetical protein
MTDEIRESTFNQAYIARTKALRLRRFPSSELMARALGIPHDRYRKYESRSPLPPYLIERFALIAGCDVEFLVSGIENNYMKRARSGT